MIKKILFIFCAMLFFSCDVEKDKTADPKVRTFWAYDFVRDADYMLQASLLAEGLYCKVWAENGSGINGITARSVANVYDSQIRGKIIDVFSLKDFDYEVYSLIFFSDAMELADLLADGDEKLCILLLDIKDGYERGKNNSYVEGYFWPGDLFARAHSNYSDMIYIDTYPGTPGSKTSNMTLAHEMQHLINYVTSVILRESPMDLWINEGLSSAAEWVYSGEHPSDKLGWFNDKRTLIDLGNNFFVWGNREEESQYAALGDYATVYLFFQWLRLQSGGTSVYSDISASRYYDHRAVTDAIDSAVPEDYSDWATLLKTWLAANYINADNGPYGYKSDPALKNVKAPLAPADIPKTIPLYPGEGVYSTIPNDFIWPSAGTNIRYASLNEDKTFPEVGSNSVKDWVLLTYNINTNYAGEIGGPEPGTITGVPAPASADTAPNWRSASTSPLRIDANDLLRRNGRDRFFSQLPDIGR